MLKRVKKCIILYYNKHIMRVVILGKGLMLANIILGVKDSGAEIAGVFHYDYTTKSKFKIALDNFFSPAPELTVINKLKLNRIMLKSANSKAFRDLMISLNVDLIIVGTWKERISSQTFNIPKIATVNVHPSFLPKYRGPNPYLQAILHGEKFSGVSIHLMSNEYDSGAILKQIKVPIYNTDTSKELRERSVTAARKLTCEFIEELSNRVLTPISQDPKEATYFPNISGQEMMLDFNMQNSNEISRTIRALHPFLPTYITYKNVFFKVNPYRFQIIDDFSDYSPNTIIAKDPKNNSITIVCRDKKSIKFTDLKLYGRKFTSTYIKRHVDLH